MHNKQCEQLRYWFNTEKYNLQLWTLSWMTGVVFFSVGETIGTKAKAVLDSAEGVCGLGRRF